MGEPDTGLKFACHRYLGPILTGVLSVIAFLSPLAMVILPKLGAVYALLLFLKSIFNLGFLVFMSNCL